MRFSIAFFVSAFATMAAAQNMFTMASIPTSISTGTTFNITWQPSTQGTISLLLVQASNPGSILVHPVATIAANLTNSGSYAWLLPASLAKGSGYAIEIVDDADTNIVNYSGQFAIDSLTLSTASGSSATGSTTTGSLASTTTSGSASSTTGSISSTLTDASTTLSTKTISSSVTSSASSISSSAFSTASKAAAAAETARSGMGLLAAVGVAVLFL